ncbi:IclR family transcriptional regulator [Leifsonia sp. A12D58]|uniref:IclR family transcriptional regulator n=1 Tax=Leifsonia sp. A12D58 TaxID=3397674 RepID=UPI0039E0E959
MDDATPTTPLAGSQTLARGIRALEILAETSTPLTIAELAAHLDVHRSIAYRIVRTLEEHGLVVRDIAGRIELGPRLAALARGVSRDLQAAALPELTQVANELGMTAFLTVLDRNEVITLVSVEPRHAHGTVAQHPGTRHALWQGAPGHAIASTLSAAELAQFEPDPRAAGAATRDRSQIVRRHGFATSHDEVIAGVSSIAVPLRLERLAPAALAVVFVGSAPAGTLAADAATEQVAARLHAAAEAIRLELN